MLVTRRRDRAEMRWGRCGQENRRGKVGRGEDGMRGGVVMAFSQSHGEDGKQKGRKKKG